MPELPEVERVRLSIARAITGLRVSGVTVHRRDMVCTPQDPPGGWSRAPEALRLRPKPRINKTLLLQGDRVRSLDRHGKQLAIFGDRAAVGIHLGMTGQLLYRALESRPVNPDHIHLTWRLAHLDGRPAGTLIFRDPRRFGGVWAHESAHQLIAARWQPLGPDALTINPDSLADSLRPASQSVGTRSVKAALLDQHTVAGIGNIYADEALFESRIRPDRPVRSLDQDEISCLAQAIRRILTEAVEQGGSTLRDYVDGDGEAGSFQNKHKVYGRGGLMCITCGRTLRSDTIAQRTTVWCDSCQR